MCTKTPVLPVEGQKNVLITSALPYVNNVPHLGNIIGCVLSADGYARYCRGRGYNTLYIGGTDEYGTATENKAREEGVSPQEICDKYHVIHREVYDWFGISFDHFGRTTTPQQTQISQEIFGKLHEKGLFSEKNVDQLFCTQCNSTLADRFVEGECPLCGADGARGDQCDGCSGLLNAIDLKNPRCKVAHSPREPLIIKSSKHLFFDLDRIQPGFEQWFETSSREGTWTPNSLAVTSAWLKKGLQPRCVTRDLKWGVPVPIEGFEDKVFYVWFDAPIGYISITACYTDEWRQWWHNPKNVELHQFIGKDNIPFHCIIFPASLIETDDNYTVLNHMSATEYLNYEGTKFSKSKGVGIFGNHCRETTIPADVWRYYLFSNRPEANDSNFAWDDLEAKSNSELLANLGNLYARVTKFVYAHFDRKVPEGSIDRFEDTDREFIAEVNTLIKEYIEDMEKAKLKDGLKTVMKISQAANGYLQRAKAWELIKSNKERCGVIMYLVLNFFRTLSALFEPFLPFTAQKANVILNLDSAPKIVDTIEFVLAPGHPLNEPVLLIPKLDPKYLKELAARFAGTDGSSSSSSSAAPDDPHSPLDIRVGVIESVEAHTESDTLFLLKVNVGEATPKDVVAGLRAHYTKEELEGRSVALLCNLKEATIRGSVSQGMCLAAEDRKTKKVRLLTPPAAAPGTPIVTQGLNVVIPPAPLDLKLDFQKLTLKTVDDAGVIKPAFFHKKTKGSHAFQTPDGAFVTVDGVSAGSKVK